MDKKTDILNLTIEELQDIAQGFGEKKYRGRQIFKWLYLGVQSFDEMTDIPKNLRSKLDEKFTIGKTPIIDSISSSSDEVTKYLFLLNDDNIIECVTMKYRYGITLCLSTQVGCRMGCKFCASTKGGLVRNMNAGEMVSQVLEVNKSLAQNDERSIKNIVLMGSGEPLDNYDNVIRFLKLVHDPQGINISYRNITVSTCGLVPNIIRLADENLPITLSISLHAPNDRLRRDIMPIATVYTIQQILMASEYYFKKTGRRVTFEYSLIDNVNDSEENARGLAERLKHLESHVNIIPVNEIHGGIYKRSGNEHIAQFMKILSEHGITVTRRRELGLDINGACGQLRRSYLDNKEGR